MLTVTSIIEQVERHGGEFILTGGGLSVLPPDTDQKKFKFLLMQVRRNAPAVLYWLRERQAARRWEASGHDPHWWRE